MERFCCCIIFMFIDKHESTQQQKSLKCHRQLSFCVLGLETNYDQNIPISHSRFKVTYPVPIQGWISQASKLQTCYKFQEFIFLGKQVILIIYAIIKQLFMGFAPALYGNALPIYATLN